MLSPSRYIERHGAETGGGFFDIAVSASTQRKRQTWPQTSSSDTAIQNAANFARKFFDRKGLFIQLHPWVEATMVDNGIAGVIRW